MSLADFKPETKTIKGRNYEFTVRALSFTDLSALIRLHYTDLEALFTIYEQEAVTGGMSTISMGRYATGLIKDAPGLVSHIIARAADEPEMVDTAGRLPLLAQVDSLQAIGKLTFEEVGGAKKLMERMMALVKDLKPAGQSKPQKPRAK
jgi:hypothetical protein